VTDYLAIMDNGGGMWGVRIPDLPGCYGAGKTAEDARNDAISAARAWAQYQTEKGRRLPIPKNLAEVISDVQPNEVVLMIPVLVDSGRPVRANISLDASLLESIDKAAKDRGLTRSAFLVSAAKDKMMEDVGVDL
jgi:predicted RNase H-like HicB family nuclease